MPPLPGAKYLCPNGSALAWGYTTIQNKWALA